MSNRNLYDFCRFCSCSFKVKFGKIDKTSYISSENIFKLSERNGCQAKATLAELCASLGLNLQSSPDFSSRVCKPCARKIKTGCEYFHFIKTVLHNENGGKLNNPTSPERFKRTLPTSISSPERSPQVNKSIKPAISALSQSRAKKSLGFKGKLEDSVLNELNIE